MSARTLLLGAVMIFIFVLFVAGIQDPDFWWHIRIGRWMVENGRLPSTDIFTFTAANHVWTDHEYLTEILMWQVYSKLGAVGVSVAFGLVTWAGFLFIFRQVRRQPFVIAAVGIFIGAVAGDPIWGPRAQMITFALSCLELYWLDGYLKGRSRAINLFPLLMVLWANLHGGWVIGFVWLGIALMAELVGWAWNPSDLAHRAHVRYLAIITAASAVAVLATPHGVNLILYPFQTVTSMAQERLIVEWFSPDFHQPYLHAFEAMIFLVIAGFALRRPSLYEFLLTMGALALALQSVRNVVLFVAAATPVMISCCSDYWRGLSARRGWRPQLPALPVFAVFTAVALVAVTLIAAVAIVGHVNPAKQQSLDASSYPIGAADWLASHPEVGRRMYNQYGWGGYLAYRFYPDPNRRVFIFGEAALMGDDLLNQYQDVQTLRSSWLQVLDRYQVDYIVYNRGEALANVLATQPGWKLVYEDSVAVIYVRA